MSTGALLFLSLLVFLILNVPVGFAIGMSAMVTAIYTGFVGRALSLSFVAQQLVVGTDSFPLMAVPLFIFAGVLMGNGGVSRRILDVTKVFFGRMWGGTAICTVAFCMFFAAVSGSGPATVAAVGALVVPTMLAEGYSKKFTLALIACAGGIGVIIPPSIPMVFYGVSTGSSIGNLFLAGFFPGILVGITLIIYSYFYSKKMGWRSYNEGDAALTQKFSLKHALKTAWDAKWALLNPFIILGGIYAGVFTPTEAAAVACVYAVIAGRFLHKELKMKAFMASLLDSVSTIGTTMCIVGCATAFARILSIQQVPADITNMIVSLSNDKTIILLLINILLLLVGMFMDTTPAMLVLAPILMPIAVSYGVDQIHFGIIMVVNLAIGFITPPLGINLFVSSRVGQARLEVVIQGILPFVLIMIFDLMLITYIPQISMFLVNLI